jgi:hypothetical protein
MRPLKKLQLGPLIGCTKVRIVAFPGGEIKKFILYKSLNRVTTAIFKKVLGMVLLHTQFLRQCVFPALNKSNGW